MTITDPTSTEVIAKIENNRSKGYAVHGGYFDVPIWTYLTFEGPKGEAKFYMGGTPAEASPGLLHEVGIERIMCLYPWEPYVIPKGVERVESRMYDSLDQTFEEVERLAEIVCEWVREGKLVLVHCQAGLNRSSLVSCVAVTKMTGLSGDEIISQLRELRTKECLCNEAFENYVRNYEVS